MNASTSTHPAGGLPRIIDNGCLELTSVIGTGAYGVVYLAIDYKYSQPLWRAVKCLRRHGLDSRQKHFQRREIALHRLASAHPSIIAMDRMIEEDDNVYVVMEFGEEGDLFAMITDQQRYVGDDELIRDVFLQLLDGVAWLHSLGISHRDIKPENIVCSQDGTRVRICDFGLATSEQESSEFGCGSTFYIAPECLGDWFPDTPSYPTRPGDVWSLGVILVNLVCGRNPWRIASPSDESFNSFLNDPNFLRRILPISSQCLFVLQQIFTINPADRISLAALRKLVLEVDTFTMGEEELRLAHYAAQDSTPTPQYQTVESLMPLQEVPEIEGEVEGETWQTEDTVFVFDELETPSLRADSGPLSSPIHRSRSSSSNGGSLPPTPQLLAEGGLTLPQHQYQYQYQNQHPFFEVLKGKTPSSISELRVNPISPELSTVNSPNPFFR
ncbi:RAN protein kinase [Kwoniella mangroviensis CBS 10435]|uniref:RAN protein kinase n=1 Tax=Kwoniella mangroviensis CBS 10435 TaxID=1331196 RepID=A0A1B9IUW7_9TREE|nr:RAN protein kinase [Kwoniella mangroviensis CBS 10435]